MYDLIIKNGKVIDGTGSPAFSADVAVHQGKIARIGKDLGDAAQVIDAAGLVVTPGFIDSHSHSEDTLLPYPSQIEKVEQGITTAISGQCGDTPAPISRDADPATAREIGTLGKSTDVYRTMGTYLDAASSLTFSGNHALFVGHSALRHATIGTENRAPSAEELEQMKALLRDGMEHGALGISFGLIYPPSCYAATPELIELASVVAEYNGLVSAHIRNEGDHLIRALDEFLTVLRKSGARGVYSHHKAMGKENWGKVSHTIRMLEEANAQGIEVYCDTYPYTASSTSMAARFVPKEYRANGTEAMKAALKDPDTRADFIRRSIDTWGEDLSWVLVSYCKNHPEYTGLLVPEIAAMRGEQPYDTVYNMIIEGDGVCKGTFFTTCEEDVQTVIGYHRTMICTDAGVVGSSQFYHPRLRGSFPRAIARYVRHYKTVTLPEMIRKMTSMPAAVYGFRSKGLVAEGFDADLCIFDPEKIADQADYKDPSKHAVGLNYVLVAGQVVVENAIHNGKCPGKLLRRSK